MPPQFCRSGKTTPQTHLVRFHALCLSVSPGEAEQQTQMAISVKQLENLQEPGGFYSPLFYFSLAFGSVQVVMTKGIAVFRKLAWQPSSPQLDWESSRSRLPSFMSPPSNQSEPFRFLWTRTSTPTPPKSRVPCFPLPPPSQESQPSVSFASFAIRLQPIARQIRRTKHSRYSGSTQPNRR